MKRDITVILLCFVAAAGGANVTPILTGSGKLEFPENATRAYLQASAGALTVASGGSNKNVIFDPSGTGTVNANAKLGFGALFTTTNGGQLKGDAGDFSTLPNTTLAIEDTDAAGGGGNAGRLLRLMNRRNTGYLAQNITSVDGTNWSLDQTGSPGIVLRINNGPVFQIQYATAGANPRTLTDLVSVTTTGIGFLVTSPSYAVDATGDINASGVFRKAGTAGISQTITIRNSAGTGTCTVTFTGGIVTATTC